MIIAQKILAKQPSLSDFQHLENHKDEKNESMMTAIYIIPITVENKKVFFLVKIFSTNWHVFNETVTFSFFMDEGSYVDIECNHKNYSKFHTRDFKDHLEGLSEENMLQYIKENFSARLKIISTTDGDCYCLYEKEGLIASVH